MLQVKNITKYYDKNKFSSVCVLKDISLTLPKVGLVSFFGPSGSGKTTLLNILSGLDAPTSGMICYDDVKIDDTFRYENVGVIFQDYVLIENKTVEENIRLGYHAVSDAELLDTLKALDIVKLKDRRVSMLSGGEKQRVSIARAIVKKPLYIICDEPTGNLDLKNRMRVMQILKSLSSHYLVLLVSHDKELVLKYSDRIYYLDDGKITREDILKEIKETDSLNEVGEKKTRLHLSKYLKDNFRMRHKTNFLLLLFTIIFTILVSLLSATITGYKYNSISIDNEYIRLKEPLSKSEYEAIKDKGAFLYDIEISDITLSNEKSFSYSPSNRISVANTTFKLYLYDGEKIIYAKEKKYNNLKSAYLTLPLAEKIIREGMQTDATYNQEVLSLKQIYLTRVEDLLGTFFGSGDNETEIIGIVESDREGILLTDDFFIITKWYMYNTIPLSIYRKYVPYEKEILDNESLDLSVFEDEFYLNGMPIMEVLSDYNFYLKWKPTYFYTQELDEVTEILDKAYFSYSLVYADERCNFVDGAIQLLFTIAMGGCILLLAFSVFFTFLDVSSYVNTQIKDIIVLRCLGISKKEVIKTYTLKLLLKSISYVFIGEIFAIFIIFLLKSYNYQTSFVLLLNPITVLISMILSVLILLIIFVSYLFGKFKGTASQLKQKNKI